MGFKRLLGDTISGLGYAASNLAGRDIGLGWGSKLAQTVNPFYVTVAHAQEPKRNTGYYVFNPQPMSKEPAGPPNPTPITGGQPTGGNGGGNNGNSGNNTSSQSSGPSPEEIYLQQMRDSFSGVKSALENQLPTYDSDFNNYKNQAMGNINQAKATLADTQAQTEYNYGNNLKNMLQANKDLRQRATGTFSSLGTLDSSAYQDALDKGDQTLKDNLALNDTNKVRELNSAKSQYDAYERQALGSIDSYQQEINRAKDGIRQAIASANLNEASSIAQYLQQLQNQKSTIESNLAAFKAQLATLQAQGIDVIGNIKKFNGADFSNTFGNLLGNQIANTNNLLTIPTPSVSGQGYIAANGKRYNSQDEYLRLLATGQA